MFHSCFFYDDLGDFVSVGTGASNFISSNSPVNNSARGI